MHRFILMFACFSLAAPQICLAEEKLVLPAPNILSNTTAQMHTPGFWIAHHPSPDAVVLTESAINAFNAHIQDDLHLTKDIFVLRQTFKTQTLIEAFEQTLTNFTNKGYYTIDGIRDSADFLDKVRHNMHINSVVLGTGPRYGLVVHFTNQRFFPTTDGLYAQKDDVDFDEIQNSGLDVGTPVAVVHTSTDGQWYYVLSPLSDGWVQAKDVAIGELDQVKAFFEDKDFIVTIKPKADIYTNEAKTQLYDILRMGVKLPLAGMDDGRVRVQLPTFGKDGKLVIKDAFMNQDDVHPGFLPYTARTIYTQALAMLNQPYGWGDLNGEQDCSRFLQMVYGTVGIRLPRDSKDQAQAGVAITEFDEKNPVATKMEEILKAQGATTILPLRGHIMLYLGSIDGRPYAIHATSSYKRWEGGKEVTRSINKVVVSDLTLGEGSQKGSLIKRIQKLIRIGN